MTGMQHIAVDLSTLKLDQASDVSFVGQIRGQISLLIADGELKPGTRLPAVRTLAAQLGVNVNTVRAAFSRLEADGLVATRHGVGTTVLPVGHRALAASADGIATNTVGVLIAGLNPFYLDLLRGIESTAEDRGTLILMVDTKDSTNRAERAIHQLIARGVDGIIAVSVGGIDEAEPGPGLPPIVYVDQPDRDRSSIVFDSAGGGALAAAHLLDHGHTRIGYVTGPLAWANQREVFVGYERTLRNADIATELLAEVSEFSIEQGQQALARLMEVPEPPTAVVASAGVLALGVLREARSRGLQVPEDLAVIGYAEDATARFTQPPLTMISVPAKAAGRQAMAVLRQLMDGSAQTAGREVFEVRLIVRESCGPHARTG
jgi:LacI family repressor for deo operon, udp, cdd, tsx, nupC, and nupG